MDFKYILTLTVDGTGIDKDAIRQLFTLCFTGDAFSVSGDENTVTITYQTNEPWKVLEYCATFGEMYDIKIVNKNKR